MPGDKRDIRVLMTTDTVGGVWNYSIRLADALQDFGARVTLATMGPALHEHQRRDLRRLANVQLYESTFKLEWMQNPWDDVDRAGRWLLALEEAFEPDVIHLNSYVHAALPWKAPVLVVGHSCVCSWFEAVRRQTPDGPWDEYRRRVSLGLRRADRVTAPTAAALTMLQRHYGTFRSTGPIYNGTDGAEAYGAGTEEVVFSVGRLWDPAKNFALLDRAAAKINTPVCVAGQADGPDAQQIALRNIQSLGYLDRKALQDWYRRTAVFVAPSLYEPFGLVALEAALARCPLVLSDIATLREVWGDAAVFFCPEDPDDLAARVNELLADRNRRNDYANRAYRRARMYTVQRMAERYYCSYLDMTNAHAPQKVLPTNASAVRNPDEHRDVLSFTRI